jgi:hypothetical protein
MAPRPVVTDTDAETTTKLMRTPAVIVTAAFLLGLVIGEAARLRQEPEATLAPLWYLAVLLVTVPFFLPSRWYHPDRTMMRGWISAAALIASIRAVFVCMSLFPRRQFGDWLMVTVLDIAVLATLWLAVFAVHRSLMPRPDPAASADD